jgi:hypothetical protein
MSQGYDHTLPHQTPSGSASGVHHLPSLTTPRTTKEFEEWLTLTLPHCSTPGSRCPSGISVIRVLATTVILSIVG